MITAPESAHPKSANSPSRILVVEDDAGAGQALRTLLEIAGYSVELVADYDGAMAKVDENMPDVVITDLELGLDDGCELARSLRDISGFRGKIVGVTGHCGITDSERMRNAGMDARFEKPLDFSALRNYLEHL